LTNWCYELSPHWACFLNIREGRGIQWVKVTSPHTMHEMEMGKYRKLKKKESRGIGDSVTW